MCPGRVLCAPVIVAVSAASDDAPAPDRPQTAFSQSAPAGKRAQSASVRFSGAIRCGISTTLSRASWHRLEYPPPRCYAGAGQTTDRRRQASHRMPRPGPATRHRRDNQNRPTAHLHSLRNDKRRRQRTDGHVPGVRLAVALAVVLVCASVRPARASRRDHCATRAALHGSFLARSGPPYQSSNPAQG